MTRNLAAAIVGAAFAFWAQPASALTISNTHIALIVGVSGSDCSGCGTTDAQGPLPFSDTATISGSTPEYVVSASSTATGSGSILNDVMSVSLVLATSAVAPAPGPGPGTTHSLFANAEAIFDAQFQLSEPTTVALLGTVSGGASDQVVFIGNPSGFISYGFGIRDLPAGSYDLVVDLTSSVFLEANGSSGGSQSQSPGIEFQFFVVPEPSTLGLVAAGLACIAATRRKRAD